MSERLEAKADFSPTQLTACISGFLDLIQISITSKEVSIDILDEFTGYGTSRLEFRGVSHLVLKRLKSLSSDHQAFLDSFVISRTTAGTQARISFICNGEPDMVTISLECRQIFLVRFGYEG